MDVTLPDGTTVKGVPDGTTKAQLAEKLKANGRSVPDSWLAPSQPDDVPKVGGSGLTPSQQAARAKEAEIDQTPFLGKVGGALEAGGAALANAPIGLAGLGATAGDKSNKSFEQFMAQHGVQPSSDIGKRYSDKLGQFMNDSGLAGLTGFTEAGVLKSAMPKLDPRAPVRPAAAELESKGVGPLTPGQRAGGLVRNLEEKSKIIPGVGHSIESAEKRRVSDFNRATADDVLSSIGEKVPDDIAPGHDTVKYTAKTVSDAYENLLGGMKGKIDKEFLDGIKGIADQAKDLPVKEQKALASTLKREILDRFKDGETDGKSLKTIESQLRVKSEDFGKSQDAYQKQAGRLVDQARAQLRGMISRANPDQAVELQKINTAYAKLVRLEGAAAPTKEGEFSAAGLRRATKAADKSTRDRDSAHGDALMQDWAKTGESILGPTMPDSGTGGRNGLIYALSHPHMIPGMIAGGALYSDPGLDILNAIMTKSGTQMPKTPRSNLAIPAAGVLGSVETQQ